MNPNSFSIKLKLKNKVFWELGGGGAKDLMPPSWALGAMVGLPPGSASALASITTRLITGSIVETHAKFGDESAHA